MRLSRNRSILTTAVLAAALSLAACGGTDEDLSQSPDDSGTTSAPTDDGTNDATEESGTGDAPTDDSTPESAGARIESILFGEFEKRGYEQVSRVTVYETFAGADVYDEAGELIEVTTSGPAMDNLRTEPLENPYDDGSQVYLAIPLEQASFAADYDAAHEVMADCTEDKRVEWSVGHTGDPVVRGICGPDAFSPTAYLRWGDKTWSSIPDDLLSAEGLAFVDEFLAHLGLESIDAMSLNHGQFSVGTPEQSVAQPDGATCSWAVTSERWSSFCSAPTAEPFAAADWTTSFSEVVPKIAQDAEPYGGIETAGFSGGISVGWPSSLVMPEADVPLAYAHTADGERIVVYGLDGEKPAFISGG